MRLILQGTGREVTLVAPPEDRRTIATVWQGENDRGVPVLALVVVLTPLIAADDPRQAQFEQDYNRVLDLSELHPEVEMFPGEVTL